jgi:hypothetical protein
MIPDIFLNLFYSFITFFVNLLPVASISSTVTTGINTFFNNVNQYNSIFPIDTAVTIMGLIVAFYVAVLLWDMVKWVIHLVRGN